MAEWLLERVIDRSSRCIIVGEISSEQLHSELSNNKRGVFWIVDSQTASAWEKREGLFIFVLDCTPLEILAEEIQSFISQDTKHLPHLKISSSILDKNSSLYDEVLSLITRITDTTQRIRNAQRLSGDVVAKNIFRNLPNFFSHRFPNSLKANAKSFGTIIVGAGPSLDVTLPIVKEWMNKGHSFVIIATDSSVKALESLGIDPHFVVVVDPYKTCESCTSSEYRKGIGVFGLDCNESWTRRWSDFYMISKNEIIEKWLYQQKIEPTKVVASSNAGLTALSLSIFLESAYSILIGMDLATDENSNLSRYAKLTGRPNVLSNRSDLFSISGNYQHQILTPFLCDWEATSKFCEQNGINHPIINFNDRGAQLKNTTLISPEKKDELYELLKSSSQSSQVKQFSYIPDIVPSDITKKIYKLFDGTCDECKRLLQPLKISECSVSEKKETLRKLIFNDNISLIFSSYIYNIMQDLVDTAELPHDTWDRHVSIMLELADFCKGCCKH